MSPDRLSTVFSALADPTRRAILARLASGGATVREAGQDPEYGLFVLLDHPEDYQTMYGHLSRIIVTVGDTVAVGEVVGLSGNTGRSTAPHLHFEIRQHGVSLDPLTMVKEGR